MVDILPLMEHFYTVQGEGAHSGTAAYFLRLGGCDVGCVWCDVKDSWDAAAHPAVEAEKMADMARTSQAEIAVVTGGEPLMYDLEFLTQTLKANGLRTHVETSGAHPLTGQWDWITFSPKKFKAPLEDFYPSAHELKVVVFNKHDFKWAEEHAARVSEDCLLFLQPEWDRRHEMMPLIVDYVKEHPRWRISLQTHKYLDIP
jgi:7-carboxy-7-deazaguanine synthase